MINHTMIVSFDQPLPDAELDRCLTDIERVLVATGLAKAFAAPGIEEVIEDWQARHPYKVGWANHAPLA